MERKTIEVVAAVIRDNDKIFATQRGYGEFKGGWEFPGGQKVTVKNGMPGQKVRFMINKKRSGRAEGRLLEVLEKSPLETREPVCSIFP